MHALHDGLAVTDAARAAAKATLDARLLQAIDPDNLLGEAERDRRLYHARKAHFCKLALASAKSRRKGRAA